MKGREGVKDEIYNHNRNIGVGLFLSDHVMCLKGI